MNPATTESIVQTATVQIDLPASLNSASSESTRSNWSHRVVLKPRDLTVEVWALFGNGTPEELWNERVIGLGSLPDGLADLAPIREALKARDADLARLASLHEIVWSGSNCVGRYTDADAANDIAQIIDAEIDRAAEECPRFWDAGEWLAGLDDRELFPDQYDGTIAAREARARDLVALARPEAHLDEADVRDALRRRWNEALDEAAVDSDSEDVILDAGGTATVPFTLRVAGRRIDGTATLYFDDEAGEYRACGDCVCWLDDQSRAALLALDDAASTRMRRAIEAEVADSALVARPE